MRITNQELPGRATMLSKYTARVVTIYLACLLVLAGQEASAQSCAGGCCDGQVDCQNMGYGLTCNYGNCGCESPSPIIIDTTGQGFHLTSAQDGVVFDILADGHPIQISWTAAGSGNAFLALDRNHNGKIDDGNELFGNVADQPKSSH